MDFGLVPLAILGGAVATFGIGATWGFIWKGRNKNKKTDDSN